MGNKAIKAELAKELLNTPAKPLAGVTLENAEVGINNAKLGIALLTLNTLALEGIKLKILGPTTEIEVGILNKLLGIAATEDSPAELIILALLDTSNDVGTIKPVNDGRITVELNALLIPVVDDKTSKDKLSGPSKDKGTRINTLELIFCPAILLLNKLDTTEVEVVPRDNDDMLELVEIAKELLIRALDSIMSPLVILVRLIELTDKGTIDVVINTKSNSNEEKEILGIMLEFNTEAPIVLTELLITLKGILKLCSKVELSALGTTLDKC